MDVTKTPLTTESTSKIPHALLSTQNMEQKIIQILKQKNLSEKNHSFFISSAAYRRPATKLINIKSAFEIARHWQVMTKTFMFTTLRSLSKLSEYLEACENPKDEMLAALQTGIHVISDDLNNNHPAFAQVAPHGPRGIHYKWWQNDIVMPLAKILNTDSWASLPLSTNIKQLLLGMDSLASEPFGFAVQLRVVEAIALPIAIAFRDIFSNVSYAGKKIFPNRMALAWIISHIKAEVTHHSQVSDNENGMAYVATTFNEQQQFLQMTKHYADLWETALNDFYSFLLESDNLNKIDQEKLHSSVAG